MRSETVNPSDARQARSRRIGRCARCHAPVLAEDEYYGDGQALVHSTCARAPTAEACGQWVEPPAGNGHVAAAGHGSRLAATAVRLPVPIAAGTL